MVVPNKERLLVSLLREIAAEGGYEFTSFSQDWILRLEKGNLVRHVFGYNFELNSATAQLLAGDKAAIADLLADRGVPHVEHRLFLHPELSGYVSADGNWPAMLAYAERTGFPLVVKPNTGTGGEDVGRVDTAAALEKGVMALFQKHRAICLSPFLEIAQEYRILMLDDECQLAYSKRRPHILGDGQSTLLELIEQQLLAGAISQQQASAAIDQHRGDLRQVPAAGQEIVVGWKHNLGEGSAPQLVAEGELRGQLIALAGAAQRAVSIRFASIDIVDAAGSLAVLEINSGVMMEHFARRLPEGRQMAKAIYTRAIKKMFAPR
jgi:glutathione synthase/RimK-type ligase-like ATP-grasp enzyme